MNLKTRVLFAGLVMTGVSLALVGTLVVPAAAPRYTPRLSTPVDPDKLASFLAEFERFATATNAASATALGLAMACFIAAGVIHTYHWARSQELIGAVEEPAAA